MRTSEWLKEKRKELGLSQEELASKIGLSPFTIMQIEQGKRLGAADTWERLESFFNDGEPLFSYDSEEIIENLKEDIEEYGEEANCYLIYTTVNNRIIFKDYISEFDDLQFDEKKDVLKNEKYIKTSLQYALEVFEAQNGILPNN